MNTELFWIIDKNTGGCFVWKTVFHPQTPLTDPFVACCLVNSMLQTASQPYNIVATCGLHAIQHLFPADKYIIKDFTEVRILVELHFQKLKQTE